jgi:thioester reductase-like protein
VLLTGATGFVGAALLAELLLQHTSAHVHCLVRCRDAGHGRERIREALARFGLWRDHFEPRLVVVAGDLARPLLGLGDAGFDYLANTIDAVYHCGAAVSAVMPYAALRAANVGGTREVLRLACRGPRAKPVHHVSTLGVFATPAYAALTEFREDADADRCDGLEGGYTQSKWVAERLVLEARARGLPVTVTRVGLVGGDQRTGVCKRDDLTLAAARACIRLGVMPDVDATLDLVPVDYVARAIGHLTRRPDSIGRVFHLANPRPMPWSAVAQWLRSRGYPLRNVGWDEIESVATAAGAEESLAVLRLLLPSGSSSAGGRVNDANARHALDGSGIDCPAVDGELLGRYLDRFVADGMLDTPSTRQT